MDKSAPKESETDAYDNELVDNKLPWDVDFGATKVGMERMMRAMVATRSHFTSSFSLADVRTPSHASVFLRVWIPLGSEQEFLRIAQVFSISPPPRVHVGMYSPPPRNRKSVENESWKGKR